MRNLLVLCILLAVGLQLSSCGGGPRDNSGQEGDVRGRSSVPIDYAKGFEVVDSGACRLVTIRDPQDARSKAYRYALVPRGDSSYQAPEGVQVILTPVERVVCMTTLQMANFLKLGATDRIVGMASTRFLFSPEMRAQLEQKRTRRIGIEGNFDAEQIMALKPDLILVSPFKKGGYESLKHLGIPLVTYLGYKESSPLGQAEWVKFIGLLLGQEVQACALFDSIATRYADLVSLAKQAESRPTVMSGELHGGNWYVVGGKNFLANQIRDAGGDYFIHNDSTGGYYMDFESVYALGAQVDYWRILNSYDGEYSYQVLGATDARYRDFQAFKSRRVIYCNLKQRPFYEFAPTEPDVVLADLIKALHPELLPEHAPVYYQLLP